ncbi:MAG: SH3 domain-containing protein [Anaerolineae bacterium]|nr:SH3 domain-containing protein [Anaerolineae bacterium]
MKKQIWFLPMLFSLTTLLVGCGVGVAEEKEIALPINRDEWPTPIPTAIPVLPTPFPELVIRPTATLAPVPVATATSTPATAVDAPVETAATGNDMKGLLTQISSVITSDLSPVAIALTMDNVAVRQGPGASYGVAGMLERSNVVGILGTNPAGGWVYVINTSLLYGWVPVDSLRITGSIEGAPVLPADPVAALLSQLAAGSSAGSTTASTTAASTIQPLAVTDLTPVVTARVNNDLLNMRQRPSADFNLLGTLSRNEEVAVLALNTDQLWALVQTENGQTGWVSVEFLDVAGGNLADAPQVVSLTPPQDYPADQLAPLAAISGKVAGSGPPQPALAAAAGSSISAESQAATAAASNQPTVPLRALAPVAQGRVAQKVDYQRGPDTASGAMGTFYVDEPVSVLAVNKQGDWVIGQGDRARVGWIPVNSLTLESGALANAYPVASAWVESNEVDVFDGPGIFHQTIGKLAINDMVAVLARNEGGNWVLVETLTGGRGWITPKFLTMMVPLADVPLADSLSFETPPPVEPAPAPGAPAYPAQNLLALQLSSGGDIMLINADGSNLRRLTHGIDPVLSPDGRSVAFTRWQGDQGSLWIINTDGTNERAIVGELRKAKGPDWSPDGSQIVLNYQHGGRLTNKLIEIDLSRNPDAAIPWNAEKVKVKMKPIIVNGRVVGMRPILEITLPPDPHWALHVVNLSDSTSRDVDGGTYAFRPAWDPAQDWRVVSDGGRGLLAIDVNRPEYRETLTEEVNDSSPVFSPDGRLVALTAGKQGGSSGYDIFRMNADGSGRVRLTKTPLWVPVGPEEQQQWNNVAPAWSPDGSQIAFLTDRTGRWEIWVMGADGSSNQRPMFSAVVNDQLDIQYNFVDERVLSWR